MDDAAVVDEEQGVAHLAEFGEDVGGDEDGFPFLGEDADEVLEFDAGLGVEAGGGFVHDEHLRIVEQRAAEAEALGHAFGEFVGEAVGERDEVGEIHDLLDALAAFLAVVAEGAGVEVEVFEHGHVLVVSEMVGHPADEAAHFGGLVDHVDAADFGASRGSGSRAWRGCAWWWSCPRRWHRRSRRPSRGGSRR